jgi:1-acyl-sn-glycerol-3-phosphate acyltransferase
MYNIILEWARLFLSLYFRRIIVYGKENVPKNVPLIVASNHPSAFMEASVFGHQGGPQIHFMVRGDVFNPKFRWLFRWTNQFRSIGKRTGSVIFVRMLPVLISLTAN